MQNLNLRPNLFNCLVLLVMSLAMVSEANAGKHSNHFKGKWEKVSNKDGVLVHRLRVKGSKLFAFRGQMTASIHIAKIIKIFIDPNTKTRKSWVSNYRSSGALSTPSPLERIYWIRFDLPWPAWDRDFVFHTRAVPNLKNRTFTALVQSIKHKKYPKQKCCVRAYARRTYYKFTALKQSKGDKQGPKTKLYVEVHTDPKGWLPAWLINKTQANWPRKTLTNLVKVSRKAGYHPLMKMWHNPKPIVYSPKLLKQFGKLAKAFKHQVLKTKKREVAPKP